MPRLRDSGWRTTPESLGFAGPSPTNLYKTFALATGEGVVADDERVVIGASGVRVLGRHERADRARVRYALRGELEDRSIAVDGLVPVDRIVVRVGLLAAQVG